MLRGSTGIISGSCLSSSALLKLYRLMKTLALAIKWTALGLICLPNCTWPGVFRNRTNWARHDSYLIFFCSSLNTQMSLKTSEYLTDNADQSMVFFWPSSSSYGKAPMQNSFDLLHRTGSSQKRARVTCSGSATLFDFQLIQFPGQINAQAGMKCSYIKIDARL